MPNTLWLWVFRALSSQGILSQRLWGGFLSNDKSRTLNLSSQPFMVVGSGLFIDTRQPDLICLKWPLVTKELTCVPTVFKHTRQLYLDYKQSWLIQLWTRFALIVFTRRHRILVKHHFSHSDGSLGPHLTVWWFLWLNKEKHRTTKLPSLRAP